MEHKEQDHVSFKTLLVTFGIIFAVLVVLGVSFFIAFLFYKVKTMPYGSITVPFLPIG